MAVIPDNWLEGTSCALWPNMKSDSKLQRAVKNKITPEDHWKAFPIRELYRDASFDKVHKKMKIAEVESDLQTAASSDESDDNEKRRLSKRKRRATAFSSDDDDDDEPSVGRAAVQPKRKLQTPPRKLPTPPRQIQKQLHAEPLMYEPTLVHSSSPHSEPPLPRLQRPTARLATESLIQSPVPVTPRNVFAPSPVPVTPRNVFAPSPVQHPSPITSRQSGISNPNISQARDIRLFTLLEKMRQEQAQQRGMLETILRLMQSQPGIEHSQNDGVVPEDINFPVNTEEGMNQLEIKLADKAVENGLVNYLSTFGGKDINDTVRRILKNVVTNKLAEKYNWFGKKGKLTFGQLGLAQTIFKAVRKNFKNVTEKEVELVTREWLRTASDREGGRKRRAEKSLQKATDQQESQDIPENS